MEPGESSRKKKTRHGGSRRGKKTRTPTIPERHLMDIPVIPEGQPQPATPHHGAFSSAPPAAGTADAPVMIHERSESSLSDHSAMLAEPSRVSTTDEDDLSSHMISAFARFEASARRRARLHAAALAELDLIFHSPSDSSAC